MSKKINHPLFFDAVRRPHPGSKPVRRSSRAAAPKSVDPEVDLYAMRHSLAHILATAIQQLWPKAKFGVGPVVENGFYYDVDLDQSLTPEDLERIEAKMREVVEADYPFERFELDIDDAIEKVRIERQDYKVELLKDLKKHGTTKLKDLGTTELGIGDTGSKGKNDAKITTVSFYKDGPFEDLCRGPHLGSTGEVGAFKLTKVSGAYWRGDQSNPQMQRVYGAGFATQAELDKHFEQLAEAEKRDHRKLGPQLGLYTHAELVGAGLPLLLPKGETVKHLLIDYMRSKEEPLGYRYVSTPVLAHEELYKRSGHAEFFADDMYSLTDDEGNKFYLKPMNCPHHHMIYEQMVQSYRDLPLKLAEPTGLYRKELSGTLSGLIRVRGPISQNDAHIYVAPDQLKVEFLKVVELFREVYDETGVANYWFRLSLPDFTAKYAGNKQRWEEAAATIREALVESGSEFVEAEGEAAFYGPKLDVQTKNVLGKEDTTATVQVDILVPERMELKYVDADNKEQTPIVIHRSILGSYERFMAFLIEQTAGALPVWLAPEQVRLATVNESDELVGYAKELEQKLRAAGVRAELDSSNESVGKKIRAAELMKVPYTIVVGEKELESGKLTPRIRKDLAGKGAEVSVDRFVEAVANEVKTRASKSSL